MAKKAKAKAPVKSTNHLDPRIVVAVGVLVAMVGGLLQHWRAAEQEDDGGSNPSIAAQNSAWKVQVCTAQAAQAGRADAALASVNGPYASVELLRIRLQ